MGILFCVLVLIISVIIYTGYHKVMKVYYFSGKAFINEILMILIISSFLAMILIALLGSAISFIFSSIGKLIGFILTAIVFIVKWGAIIGGIVLIGAFIKKIFFKDKNNININLELIKDKLFGKSTKVNKIIRGLVFVVICLITTQAILSLINSKNNENIITIKRNNSDNNIEDINENVILDNNNDLNKTSEEIILMNKEDITYELNTIFENELNDKIIDINVNNIELPQVDSIFDKGYIDDDIYKLFINELVNISFNNKADVKEEFNLVFEYNLKTKQVENYNFFILGVVDSSKSYEEVLALRQQNNEISDNSNLINETIEIETEESKEIEEFNKIEEEFNDVEVEEIKEVEELILNKRDYVDEIGAIVDELISIEKEGKIFISVEGPDHLRLVDSGKMEGEIFKLDSEFRCPYEFKSSISENIIDVVGIMRISISYNVITKELIDYSIKLPGY